MLHPLRTFCLVIVSFLSFVAFGFVTPTAANTLSSPPADCSAFEAFLSTGEFTLDYSASLGTECVTISTTLDFGAGQTITEIADDGTVLDSYAYEITESEGQCALASATENCGAQLIAFNGDNTALTLTAGGGTTTLTPVAQNTNDWGIWQSYVILDAGLGNNYRAGGLNPDAVHPSFAGADLGAFASTGSTLSLNGGEIKTYKNNSANVCGGNIQYRVYSTGDAPGSFNGVALAFAEDLGNGNQKWSKDDAGVNLLSGLTPGDYTLEIYWDADGDTFGGCGSTNYESNNGANYTASFSVFTPIYGCMDSDYTEYNSAANTDDSSCETLSRCSSQTIDGHIYSVLEIGDQCWFAENLRSAVYADGSAIPEATNNGTWSNLNSGGQSTYDNDPSNLDDYGRLYNWQAVEDNRGLCPSGYSVPDDSDVQTLIDEIGGQGALKLKSTSGWTAGPNGTDDYGFDGRPAGYRGASGSFANLTTLATWWTSSPNLNGGDAHVYSLIDNSDEVYRQYGISRQQGRSIRCVQNILEGCTDPEYIEFDATATSDNGSCANLVVLGCTDNEACNYDASANSDDSSCILPAELTSVSLVSGATTLTSTDGEISIVVGNGTPVSVELSGNNSSSDYSFAYPGTYGGIAAGYYSVTLLDASSCSGNAINMLIPYTQCCSGCGIYDSDTDGICDDSDNCINKLATNYADPNNLVCIVNGCTDPVYTEYNASATNDDGSCATLVVEGCTDSDYLEYDASANTDDGSCATLASTCVSPSMDGHSYGVVEIGDQCWFAENLRTTVYADGAAIPEVTDNTAWTGLSTGARCDYNNDASNVATYGRLYNWYAATDDSELCPTGWHVPTDGEWTALETYLGANGHGGTEGTALKSTSGWNSGGNGTDDFGFSALPGGLRSSFNGYFLYAGYHGNWWSSSPSIGLAWNRYLDYDNPDIGRGRDGHRAGFSVRCLRDAD